MNKNIFYIAATFLLLSCGSIKKENTSEEEEIDVEVVVAEEMDVEQITPNIELNLDSLALIAWGDAQFGMTKKQAKNTHALKRAEDDGKEYLVMLHNDATKALRKSLGLWDDLTIWVTFKAKKKGICEVSINSGSYEPERYTRMLSDCKTVCKKLEETYGSPTYKGEAFDIKDLIVAKKKFPYLTWVIDSPNNGTKTIAVSYEHYVNNIYRFHITIENTIFPYEKTPAELNSEKEQRKKDEEIQKSVRYAF